MKHLPCIVLFLLFSLLAAAQNNPPALIPMPQQVSMGKGNFTFSSNTIIEADAGEKRAAQFLTDYLHNTWHFNNKVMAGAVKANANQPVVTITTRGSEQIPAEGYRLTVTPTAITLTGKGAGLFYGIQTLLQLFPVQVQGTAVLPCVNIEDKPHYAYRGLMLDVSRHFFTVSQIKDLLDLMAYYKLNRFHWHLTDDQGWRLEIKSYPKLTSVGAWRVPRSGDFGANLLPPQPGEKATDGGFYTQEQVKEIIRYAAERHIEVMPEIDVPGHSLAAVASYPELCVTRDTSLKVNPGSSFSRWFTGGFEMYLDNTLNPTDEKVYAFLDKVFGEVAQLFPYPYIHIGGDECFKGFWEKDAGVKTFMQQHNIKDAHALQSYFISRVNKIVQAKHKKLIGWDEILDGGLSDSVALTARYGSKRVPEQIRSGHDIIACPSGSGMYFDWAQSESDMEPDSHGGNSPLWKTYAYNPVVTGLTAAEQKHILGVEGCVWTEHVASVPKLQFMLLPRMLALAELAWTDTVRKSYITFSTLTLPTHLQRFDQSGINYRVPTVFKYNDTTIVGKSYTLNVKAPLPGAKIYYSVSNRQPTDVDHEYTGPVTFTVPTGKKLMLKTIVLTPAGHRSIVNTTVIDNTAK